jgi:hypothetical protein
MGVHAAAPFKKGNEPHPAVSLQPNGTLHQWTERLQSGWQAESVEEAELVVVLPNQKKTLLQVAPFSNGVAKRRFKFDLDVRVLEAKTGKLVAFRHFENVARPFMHMEAGGLTELGDPVQFRDVYRWVQNVAMGRSVSHES